MIAEAYIEALHASKLFGIIVVETAATLAALTGMTPSCK